MGPVVQEALKKKLLAFGTMEIDHEVRPPATIFGPPTVYLKPLPSL